MYELGCALVGRIFGGIGFFPPHQKHQQQHKEKNKTRCESPVWWSSTCSRAGANWRGGWSITSGFQDTTFDMYFNQSLRKMTLVMVVRSWFKFDICDCIVSRILLSMALFVLKDFGGEISVFATDAESDYTIIDLQTLETPVRGCPPKEHMKVFSRDALISLVKRAGKLDDGEIKKMNREKLANHIEDHWGVIYASIVKEHGGDESESDDSEDSDDGDEADDHEHDKAHEKDESGAEQDGNFSESGSDVEQSVFVSITAKLDMTFEEKNFGQYFAPSSTMASINDWLVSKLKFQFEADDLAMYHYNKPLTLNTTIKEIMTRREAKGMCVELVVKSMKMTYTLSPNVEVCVYRERVFWKEGDPEYIPLIFQMPRHTTTIADVKTAVEELKGTSPHEYDLYHQLKKADDYRRVQEFAEVFDKVCFHTRVKALGGGGVKKNFLKKKFVATTVADKPLFEGTFVMAQKATATENVSIKDVLNKMECDTLTSLKEYLKHDKTTASTKLLKIADYDDDMKKLDTAIQKLTSAREKVADLIAQSVVDECAKGERNFRMDSLTTMIEIVIGMKSAPKVDAPMAPAT